MNSTTFCGHASQSCGRTKIRRPERLSGQLRQLGDAPAGRRETGRPSVSRDTRPPAHSVHLPSAVEAGTSMAGGELADDEESSRAKHETARGKVRKSAERLNPKLLHSRRRVGATIKTACARDSRHARGLKTKATSLLAGV